MNLEYIGAPSPEEPSRYGEFAANGLLPGIGTAVGTAMRRVLLSSVPGAAVVWMRIDGVGHEFSTVPGVKEDVSQILLRVKKLILRVRDRGVHRMYLAVQGRNAMASDFVGDGDVEVINPELPVATLGENAVLNMEIWVQGGRDHGMSDGERSDVCKSLGMIYADPVYSPVEKVAVDVREQDDHDDLLLRVWTNGAVSPVQAVDWAGKILRDLSAHVDFSVQKPLPVSALPEQISLASVTLEELSLSKRSYNRLRRAHFQTIQDILQRSRTELYAIPELGPKTITELEEQLEKLGLALRSERHRDAS